MSCAKIQLASNKIAGIDEDDVWEDFVAAWCVHPGLIPDQKILIILEPRVPHKPNILLLRVEEVIQVHLPTWCYLAHLQPIEYQDWASKSSSSDDDYYSSGNDDFDSGDNNYNGYHPRFKCPSHS